MNNPLADIWITVLQQMLRVARNDYRKRSERGQYRLTERVEGQAALIIGTLSFPAGYADEIVACIRSEQSTRDTIKHIEVLRKDAL